MNLRKSIEGDHGNSKQPTQQAYILSEREKVKKKAICKFMNATD